jgi:hypothetical protein
MQTELVDLTEFPLKINYRVSVKILLPGDVYRKISETVRRFNRCGLWRITLSQIFLAGFFYIEANGGLEGFVSQLNAKKEAEKRVGEEVTYNDDKHT